MTTMTAIPDTVTLRDRLHAAGVRYTKRDHWALGAMVREHYRRKHGRLPAKSLIVKTCGIGSHCFAVYPATFTADIDRLIGAHFGPDPQGRLFG